MVFPYTADVDDNINLLILCTLAHSKTFMLATILLNILSLVFQHSKELIPLMLNEKHYSHFQKNECILNNPLKYLEDNKLHPRMDLLV